MHTTSLKFFLIYFAVPGLARLLFFILKEEEGKNKSISFFSKKHYQFKKRIKKSQKNSVLFAGTFLHFIIRSTSNAVLKIWGLKDLKIWGLKDGG